VLRIGLISDTHGLLRPEAQGFLRGCDHIVHGGDIGDAGILAALAQIAPVTAVRGNNDAGAWASGLPATETLQFGGVSIFVLHDLDTLRRHPAPDGTQVIVCGHSHRPRIWQETSGPLVVNPGSAGPRRFTLPVSVAELLISPQGGVSARVVDLLQAGATPLGARM
jgi:hypothetical protein